MKRFKILINSTADNYGWRTYLTCVGFSKAGLNALGKAFVAASENVVIYRLIED